MTTQRLYSPRKILAALIVLAVLVFWPYLRAARAPRAYAFGGDTMGTTYTVKIVDTQLSESAVRALQRDVEVLLDQLSAQMSTYDPTSEISAFNQSTGRTPFTVSANFAAVTDYALKVADHSGGAFDPTVMPLINLWGFGPNGAPRHVPSHDAISSCRAATGYRTIKVLSDITLMKLLDTASLDLNALAKGYAVDCTAAALQAAGCPNVFVEIGGEIVAAGSSGQGEPWRVSVEVPQHGAGIGEASFAILPLRNQAVATSGDYRNYFEDQGRVFSHILDPRTGYPITNGVASVTVVAKDCMTADALATALMVLGVDGAEKLLNHYPDTEAMIIERQAQESFTAWRSAGFPR
ncbi:MAG: FAD:protein FMN transferase [Verrucomicrobia bacterium]|nr:FAD:protein FMN transferase [Verrucomicrobiota bacterium]